MRDITTHYLRVLIEVYCPNPGAPGQGETFRALCDVLRVLVSECFRRGIAACETSEKAEAYCALLETMHKFENDTVMRWPSVTLFDGWTRRDVQHLATSIDEGPTSIEMFPKFHEVMRFEILRMELVPLLQFKTEAVSMCRSEARLMNVAFWHGTEMTNEEEKELEAFEMSESNYKGLFKSKVSKVRKEKKPKTKTPSQGSEDAENS